jgi:hypothetical protein
MSKWKNSESWNRGQEVEHEFANLLRKRDPDFRKATKQEQYRHIDYHSYFGTIDVKAKKRISRSDSSEQDDLIWLEFKNVQGKKGWLTGETSVIAFERDNDFVLFLRKNILYWAQRKCDLNDKVLYSKDALYKGYTRKGRNDLISIVNMQEMIDEVAHRIWEK